MSYDREKQLGELLDQALGEKLGLYFQPAWHPSHALSRRRTRNWRIALGTVGVAAAIVLALPFTVQLPHGHGAVSNRTLSAIHLPKRLTRIIAQVSQGPMTVASMVPVYASYPLARPTGHNLSITGTFHINGATGTSLSLLVNNHMQMQGGMIFHNGRPVYVFTGSNPHSGTAINAPNATPVQSEDHVKAQWYPGGNVAIGTFSAAGSHVYVTHGNLWSDMIPGSNDYWIQSPASPPATTIDSIAGLPADPADAVLTEESPSGLSRGFVTTNGGITWQGWGLGSASVSTLIAINHRFWAILNGTLAWSTNGFAWNSILPLNPKNWQVETYAVDPANPEIVAVSLIPISGDGLGPVLETRNGGKTWAEVPHFPAIGAAPTTMVMNTNGDIAALINADGPVVVRYVASQQRWSVLPIPAAPISAGGLGQLAASANGNLIYGAPGGAIYQWIANTDQWLVIKPPPGLDSAGLAANPLQAVGNNQILAGYPSGWAYFYEPVSESTGTVVAKSAIQSDVTRAGLQQ
ncbi:MAG: hypothetical protein C7B45_13620 [Sulfobacillus acidophilus]|uniref:Photosynthesis system II assembly factor Ycf48/Hcf136-like domain-containing protein n=1 Tax=Sulfobacillus acidophilus TaxID=53633 RepID=A0A2T2WEQ1_9FIRM|nr:MAG: hypothetical protein C7B45_13620 [Sulfobacillus acidophilus]